MLIITKKRKNNIKNIFNFNNIHSLRNIPCCNRLFSVGNHNEHRGAMFEAHERGRAAFSRIGFKEAFEAIFTYRKELEPCASWTEIDLEGIRRRFMKNFVGNTYDKLVRDVESVSNMEKKKLTDLQEKKNNLKDLYKESVKWQYYKVRAMFETRSPTVYDFERFEKIDWDKYKKHESITKVEDQKEIIRKQIKVVEEEINVQQKMCSTLDWLTGVYAGMAPRLTPLLGIIKKKSSMFDALPKSKLFAPPPDAYAIVEAKLEALKRLKEERKTAELSGPEPEEISPFYIDQPILHMYRVYRGTDPYEEFFEAIFNPIRKLVEYAPTSSMEMHRRHVASQLISELRDLDSRMAEIMPQLEDALKCKQQESAFVDVGWFGNLFASKETREARYKHYFDSEYQRFDTGDFFMEGGEIVALRDNISLLIKLIKKVARLRKEIAFAIEKGTYALKGYKKDSHKNNLNSDKNKEENEKTAGD